MSAVGIGVVAIVGALVALAYAVIGPQLQRVGAEPEKERSTPVYDLLEGLFRTINWRPLTEQELSDAGIRQPAISVIAMTLVASAALFLVTVVLRAGPLVAVLALVLPPVVAKLWIRSQGEKRRTAFAEQMQETMTMFSSALKSGLNVSNALASVAADIDAPMGEELSRVVNEARLGRDVVLAMRESAERMRNDDLRWVADALAIQRETGGRLSDVLAQVNGTIAERHSLRVKLKALSSEGRMSGIMLMALPIITGAMFLLMNRSFLSPLFSTGIGHLLLLSAAVLWCGGGLWLRSLARVEF